MTAPHHQVIQVAYENPDAEGTLHVPVRIMCNTPDGVLDEQVRVNTARKELRWLEGQPENDEPAIMVGGGASAADFLPTISNRQRFGGKIFAMNAASQWLRGEKIYADYQCILDAKEETSSLVDIYGPENIIASQAHPTTMETAEDPLVWHLETGEIERNFPDARIEAGGYCLLAGGASCGNSAMAVAYALGHREFHVFGYDCSHRGKDGHAYGQTMNELIPTMEMEWGGKTYTLSIAMKGQIMAFQVMAGELKRLGCTVEVYGDGLLQDVYRTKIEDLSERDKYRAMWNIEDYRNKSPGEGCVDQFLDVVNPDGLVLDFGCGTGRASLAIKEAGHDILLIDFADNCRDREALDLPFLEWDLNTPIALTADWGICCDVMEHIPPDEVDTVITNIMSAASTTYFQICTILDNFGKLMNTPLHLTVRPTEWWEIKFKELGYNITWLEQDLVSCRLVVTSED